LEPLARILNVSGCHPRDLQREFVSICRQLPIPKRAWEPMRPSHVADLSHVLARWHADEQYVDPEGRPVPLPLEGPEPSLKGLVSRVLPGMDAAQAIQWLTELKGIRREGRRYFPTDKYLAFNRLPAAAWAHGLAAVLGMLRTVEHNVSAPPQKRLLERIAINPRFPVRALPRFHRELKRQAGEIVWRFDSDMGRGKHASRASPSRASVLASTPLRIRSSRGVRAEGFGSKGGEDPESGARPGGASDVSGRPPARRPKSAAAGEG
jgi:hypothetical protein